MPRDDVAMRSQEFAQRATESVQPAQQNMQRSLEHFSQTMAQGVQIAQQGRQLSMEEQELALRKDLAASSLAMDRIRKQQAMEELNWGRELHTSAMLEDQRRVSTANADLAVAQAADAQKKLNLPPAGARYGDLPAREMALIRKMGGDLDPKTGAVRDASPEMQADATKWLERDDRLTESQIEANKGRAIGAQMLRRGRGDTDRLNALKIEQNSLLDRREGLKGMPIGTPAEKKARDAEAADINKGIKAVQEEARKLREGHGSAGKADTAPAEEISDTALDELLKALLQPEPKK